MLSMKVRLAVLLLIAGLLSACASQGTQTPASPATSAPAATDTSAPAVESSPTAAASSGAAVSFANDILPLLQSRCINCHGGDRTEENLSLKSYSDVMAGSKNGAVVVPGDAANSLMAELVGNQKMPKRGPKLTPPQVQLIIDWINQGALNN